MNEFRPGTEVRILQCAEYPMLIGKIATVMERQDCPGKIRVSFSEEWQGYFKPTQIERYEPVDEMLNRHGAEIARELGDFMGFRVRMGTFAVFPDFGGSPRVSFEFVKIYDEDEEE